MKICSIKHKWSVIFAMLVSVFVMQQAYAVQHIWGGVGKVSHYFPTNESIYHLFRLDIPHLDPLGCGRTDWYAIETSNPSFEEYKKLILTAKVSGLELGIYVDTEEGHCRGPYPVITRMWIR